MTHRSPVGKGSSLQLLAIPNKLCFRIGEVARLCEVPAYVLRFWESEFPQLRPNKGGTGQRLFRQRDVEMALRIRSLLYEEGYTIPGARQLLKGEQKQKESQLSLVPDADLHAKQLRSVRNGLRELLTVVSRPDTVTARETPRQARSPNPVEQGMENLFDFVAGHKESGKD